MQQINENHTIPTAMEFGLIACCNHCPLDVLEIKKQKQNKLEKLSSS